MIGVPESIQGWRLSFDSDKNDRVRALLEEANDVSRMRFSLESWRAYRSDNQSGFRNNVPSAALFDHLRDGRKDSKNHSEYDTAERLNYPYALSVTKLAGTILLAANRDELYEKPAPPPLPPPSERKSPLGKICDVYKWVKGDPY